MVVSRLQSIIDWPAREAGLIRRALETLPARITALQMQIGSLNIVLADPDLCARDPARFTATTEALAVAQDELATAEERRLSLEILREEIDGVERKP